MGRKTLVQFVCFLKNYKFYTPLVTRDYGIREFRKEIKILLEEVGC